MPSSHPPLALSVFFLSFWLRLALQRHSKKKKNDVLVSSPSLTVVHLSTYIHGLLVAQRGVAPEKRLLVELLSKLCQGFEFTAAGESVPQLVYADDCLLLSNDIATMQLALECAWLVTKICGNSLQVKKKKKSAWSATYWKEGTEVDVTGYEMKMPDGTNIPQLVGDETYKYLGTELRPGWACGEWQKDMRERVKRDCKRALWLVGNLSHLTVEQMRRNMALALSGIIGYYGRSTVITWEDCEAIEQVRASALRARRFSVGVPKLQMYDAEEGAGMEMEHAYTYAVAALVDQVDRALCATEGEPARLAAESSLAHTLKRLGCRSDSPLEWKPPWDWEKELSDDLVIEAYLKARWRSGADTLSTAGWRERAKGPLRPSAWAVTENERAERGSMLYEWQCATVCADRLRNARERTFRPP